MQFQRIMLFAALGLVLVMIWQSWVEFQTNYAASNGQSSGDYQNAGSSESPSNLSDDVPDAPDFQTDASEESVTDQIHR